MDQLNDVRAVAVSGTDIFVLFNSARRLACLAVQTPAEAVAMMAARGNASAAAQLACEHAAHLKDCTETLVGVAALLRSKDAAVGEGEEEKEEDEISKQFFSTFDIPAEPETPPEPEPVPEPVQEQQHQQDPEPAAAAAEPVQEDSQDTEAPADATAPPTPLIATASDGSVSRLSSMASSDESAAASEAASPLVSEAPLAPLVIRTASSVRSMSTGSQDSISSTVSTSTDATPLTSEPQAVDVRFYI